MASLRVLVLGGGIAGCTTALALHKKGFAPQVYDAAPAPAADAPAPRLGGGFTLQSNGLHVLHRLGLLDDVRALGNSTSNIGGFYTIQGGRRIATFDLSSSRPPSPEAFHSCHLLRSRLHEYLLSRLAASGIPMHYSKKATQVSQSNDEVVVAFADGSEVSGDLVVGADGVHSTVRRLVFGADLKANFTGAIGYLGVVECATGDVAAWQSAIREMTPLSFFNDPQHKRFVLLMDSTRPTSTSSEYCFAIMETQPPDIAQAADYRPYSNLPAEAARLADHVASWGMPPSFANLVRGVTRLTPVSIYEAPALESFVKGRVVLVGDAAHGMRPDLGQGVNTALEDAATLAELLASCDSDPKYPKRALEHFVTLRVRRCNALVAEARTRNERSHASSAFGALMQRRMLQFFSLLSCIGVRPMVHPALAYDFEKEVAVALQRTT